MEYPFFLPLKLEGYSFCLPFPCPESASLLMRPMQPAPLLAFIRGSEAGAHALPVRAPLSRNATARSRCVETTQRSELEVHAPNVQWHFFSTLKSTVVCASQYTKSMS